SEQDSPAGTGALRQSAASTVNGPVAEISSSVSADEPGLWTSTACTAVSPTSVSSNQTGESTSSDGSTPVPVSGIEIGEPGALESTVRTPRTSPTSVGASSIVTSHEPSTATSVVVQSSSTIVNG